MIGSDVEKKKGKTGNPSCVQEEHEPEGQSLGKRDEPWIIAAQEGPSCGPPQQQLERGVLPGCKVWL